MNALTHAGEALAEDAVIGAAASIRLFTSASVPKKSGVLGTDFIEVPNGNGYTTGGHAIVAGDWVQSIVEDVTRRTLPDHLWHASGTGLSNIAGECLVSGDGSTVLGFRQRSTAVSIASGGDYLADNLYIG